MEPFYSLETLPVFEPWTKPKLAADGSNHDEWRTYILDALYTAGKHDIIYPATDAARSVHWHANNMLLKFWLMNTVSTPVAEKLLALNFDTPGEMLEYLKTIYRTSYFTRLDQWNTLIRELKQAENETLVSYIDRAKDVWRQYYVKNLNKCEGSQQILLVQFLDGIRCDNVEMTSTVERIRGMFPLPSIDLASYMLITSAELVNAGVTRKDVKKEGVNKMRNPFC